jgi:hypothetical protein
MSLYYRTLIQGGLLLDTYPNAAVAYSLRKLREGYKKVFNLLSYSEDISQATYTKSALITTGTPPYIDVVTAPNGTMTADKLIEDTANGFHFLTQTLGITVVGLDYNFSVYLKAGERTKTDIQAGGVGQARINLLTGAIETSTFPITPIVTDAGNGWWRFSVTFNANSTLINPLYRIFNVNALNTSSYVGDGVSGLYVWGFQLTQSSSVLPYEKTIVGPSNGSAIRVRRGDLTEQDFGFNSSGVLDTDAIINFFGNNLLTQSENFEIITGGWGRTSTNVIAGSIVGPNGTDLSCKLNETSTSGVHALTALQFSTTIGKDYFISIYLKSGERDVVDFTSLISASNTCRLNLTTGTIVSNNFTNTPTLTDVGSGWWKFELVLTATNSLTSTGFQLRLTNGTTQTYVGNVGWGCYIWGAQVSGYTGKPVPYFRTTTTTAASAFVSRYYDQSENGNNLTNASSALQYRIVVNGHLYVNSDNGLASTDVVSTGFYNLAASVPTGNPYVNFNVYKSEPGNMILFGNSSVGGRPIGLLHNGSAGSRNILTRLTLSSTQDISIPFETNGSFITSITRDTSNNVQITANDSLVGTSSLATAQSANLSVMGRYNSSANSSTGEIQELIIWKQNYISLKDDISDKINEYYGIY